MCEQTSGNRTSADTVNAEARLTETCAGMSVLLVEDEPINQIVAQELLSKTGLIIDTADNGLQAVEKAKANPKLAGWFTGQVIKASGGKANPATVNALVAAKLGL